MSEIKPVKLSGAEIDGLPAASESLDSKMQQAVAKKDKKMPEEGALAYALPAGSELQPRYLSSSLQLAIGAAPMSGEKATANRSAVLPERSGATAARPLSALTHPIAKQHAASHSLTKTTPAVRPTELLQPVLASNPTIAISPSAAATTNIASSAIPLTDAAQLSTPSLADPAIPVSENRLQPLAAAEHHPRPITDGQRNVTDHTVTAPRPLPANGTVPDNAPVLTKEPATTEISQQESLRVAIPGYHQAGASSQIAAPVERQTLANRAVATQHRQPLTTAPQTETQSTSIRYRFSQWGDSHYVNINRPATEALPLRVSVSDSLVQQRLSAALAQPDSAMPSIQAVEWEQEQQSQQRGGYAQPDEDESC